MTSRRLVINGVRVLGSGPHTLTNLFWEYPPGVENSSVKKRIAKTKTAKAIQVKTIVLENDPVRKKQKNKTKTLN